MADGAGGNGGLGGAGGGGSGAGTSGNGGGGLYGGSDGIDGSTAGSGGAAGGPGANGADGGVGVSSGILTNSGSVTGGGGGGGGTTGMGGNGGDGVASSLDNASLANNGGSITGGGGGGGGSNSNVGSNSGGSGGDGVAFSGSDAVLTNSGTIAGGGGGGGGFAVAPGGNGGGGIVMSGGGTIDNSGSIKGGTGGGSGYEDTRYRAGSGGAGIAGAGLTVTNSGTIAGGFSIDGNGPQANAIQFTGGVNTLELQQGSTISGNVVGVGGGTDTLRLGGAGNAGFDVSRLGTQYENFAALRKTGDSTWTLQGSTSAATPWTISQGTLAITTNTSLGAGTVTIDGGTLLAAADGLVVTNNVAVNTTGGTVDNNGNGLTLSGTISDGNGQGGLAFAGAGTTTLTGTNTYSGGTTLAGGTVSVSSNTNLGAAAGALTFDGGVLRVTGSSFTSTSRTINWGPGGGGFDIADAAANFTVSQTLTGTGGLTKLGVGTLTLTGVNSYSGGTVVNGGTLRINNDAALGDVSGALTLNGGALQVTGNPINFTLQRQIVLGANGGTFDVGAGKNLILNGAVSGDGQLTKTSAGTLTLNSANSYSGGTFVSGGSLVVAATGALGDSAVTLNADGSGGWPKLYFSGDASNPVSARNLSITVGSGDVNFQGRATAGAATIVLTKDGYGALNFTTGTDAGTAVITNKGGGEVAFTGASAKNATIVNDGLGIPYYFSRTTFDDDYSRNVFSSAGNATITNRNGGSTVFYGHSDGGSATLVNEAGGTIDFQGASQARDATILNGAGGRVLVRFRDQGPMLDIGSLSGDGAVEIDDSQQAPALSLGALGHEDVISGVISGNGSLTKTGPGQLTLNGQNTYTGLTTVAGGTLVVGDDSHAGASLAGDVTVNSGARLGGVGTISGDVTILAGGTHGAGNSIGVQTIDGNYLNHGVLEVEATPSGADRLIVGGTVDITGATLNLILTPTTAASWNLLNGPYTIIQNEGATAVEGTFASVGDLNDLLFLDHLINYHGGDGNDVTLSLLRNDVKIDEVAVTSNQTATANALDRLGAGNALAWAMLLLTDKDAARLALDAASGDAHASAKGMLVEDSRFVADAATARIRSAFDSVAAPALPVMAYGEGGTELVAADTSRFAVWGQAFGSWAKTNGDGNAAGFDRSTGGFLTGGDAAIGNAWRVGLLTGYNHTSFDVDDRASSGSSDSYHVGLYGGGQWRGFGLRGGAAYSWNRIETSRSVVIPGFADALTAKYDAGTAQVFGEAGYRADTGTASFEPFANLAHVSLHTGGFREKGGAAALTSAASTTQTTFTTLGLRASTGFVLGGMQASAQGTLGWRHAFGDTTPVSNMALAGSDLFTIAGVPIARDSAIVEAGLDLSVSDMAKLGLTYSGRFASSGSDNGFKADLSVKF